MLSSHTALLLLLLAFIAIVGSTNGEPGCDFPPTRADMYDEQAQRSLDNADKFNRMTLDCETTGEKTMSVDSNANSSSERIIDISVGVFFIFCVAMAIWLSFVRRRNAMNAAAVKPYSGEMEGQEMGEKQKSVTMNAPMGKLPKSDTNV